MEPSYVVDTLNARLREIPIRIRSGVSSNEGTRQTNWIMINSAFDNFKDTWAINMDYYSKYPLDVVAVVVVCVYFTDYEHNTDTTANINDTLQICFPDKDDILEQTYDYKFINITPNGEVYCAGIEIFRLDQKDCKNFLKTYMFRPPRTGPARIIPFPDISEEFGKPVENAFPRITAVSYNLLKDAGKILDAIIAKVTFNEFVYINQKEVSAELKVTSTSVSEICRMLVKCGILIQGKKWKNVNSYKLNSASVLLKRSSIQGDEKQTHL